MYSEGFETANALAKKLVAVFQLSRQLLSPQQHYDWGLRALKTILRVGGQLISEEKKSLAAGTACAPELEEQILIKALRINTLSKLTHGDTEAFNALWRRLPRHGVTTCVRRARGGGARGARRGKLEVLPCRCEDVQFYEATMQRMGVVSSARRAAASRPSGRCCACARQAGQKIPPTCEPQVDAARAAARAHGHGHARVVRRRADRLARKVVREPPEVKSWIICDGDIDPEWVESLNSVLDDNRLLTMPSGERIQFAQRQLHLRDARPQVRLARHRLAHGHDLPRRDGRRPLHRRVLAQQPEEGSSSCGLDGRLLFRALEWVLLQEAVVDTTKAGSSSPRSRTSRRHHQGAVGVRGHPRLRRQPGARQARELAKLLYSGRARCPPTCAGARRLLQRQEGQAEALPLDASSSSLADFATEGAVVRTAAVQRDEHLLGRGWADGALHPGGPEARQNCCSRASSAAGAARRWRRCTARRRRSRRT